MTLDLLSLGPTVAAVLFFVIVMLVASATRFHEVRARRGAPFTDDFLRSPGHSLRTRVEAAARGVASATLVAGVWPLLVYSAWSGAIVLLGWPQSVLLAAATVALIVLGAIVTLVRVFRAEQTFRRCRLLLDGEIAAGQALTQLLRQGCRVVHDVSVPGARLSHVVVAPTGVFAVRTLTRRGAGRGRGKEDVTVYAQGDELRFPDTSDVTSVPRARKAAQLLADRLREPLGRPVEVRPVLALPGWFVDSRTGTDVPVVNPRDASRLLVGARVLNDAAMDELVELLEVLGPASARRVPPVREPLLDRKEPRLE
jgi:hypothetical protein